MSKLTRAKQLMEGGMSQRKAAGEVSIPQATLSEALKREGYAPPKTPAGPEPAGITKSDHDASITSKPLTDPRGVTPDQLLQKHGLDPEDWIVTSIRVSEWGKTDEPMFQLRVNATRRDGLVVIPTFGDDFTPWEYGQIAEYQQRSVALIPDLHAPFHDERALRAVCDLLAVEQPEQVIFLGDVADNSMLSKHRTHRRFGALLNETNDAVVQNFRRVREAVPNAQIVLLPGNHDDRVLYYVQDMAPEFEALRPGKFSDDEVEPQSSIGFRQLWRLDELGIEVIDEDWKLAQFGITPELSARHGYLTGNNSERKLMEHHGRSQIHGHDHRGSIVYQTKHDPLDIRVAMSCGTLSEIKPDGLGYAPAPDWTPGIGWCQLWDDGLFQLSFLPFIKGKLLTPWGVAYEGKSA